MLFHISVCAYLAHVRWMSASRVASPGWTDQSMEVEAGKGWLLHRQQGQQIGDTTSVLTVYNTHHVTVVSCSTMQVSLRDLKSRARVHALQCVHCECPHPQRTITPTQGSLWKLVRASMTIVGLLPPVYENGDLLVDGGYM